MLDIVNEILSHLYQVTYAANRLQTIFWQARNVQAVVGWILYWNVTFFLFKSFYVWILAVVLGVITEYKLSFNAKLVPDEANNNLKDERQTSELSYVDLAKIFFSSSVQPRAFLVNVLGFLRGVRSADFINYVLVALTAGLLFYEPLLAIFAHVKSIFWLCGNIFFWTRFADLHAVNRFFRDREFNQLQKQLAGCDIGESLEAEDSNGIFHMRYDRDSNCIVKTFSVYENQRWWLGIGWCNELFSTERRAWSNASGSLSADSLDALAPVSVGWRWLDDDWLVETAPSVFVPRIAADRRGWQFSASTHAWRNFYWNSFYNAVVRRRHFVRRATLACDDEKAALHKEAFVSAAAMLLANKNSS